MADVRALLKAKRLETQARVSHPLASYTSSGQLRCTICGIAVKQWEGHIGSKAHRVKFAEEKKRESERAAPQHEQSPIVRGKRKADPGAEQSGEDEDHKKRRMGDVEKPNAIGAFPADFFSDPSRAPPPALADEDGDEDVADSKPPPPQSASEIDAEYAAFQLSLSPSTSSTRTRDPETYQNATVFAEPVLASSDPEGFPARAAAESDDIEEVKEESEEDKRRRNEREDRELIMDRLMDEERAQEEADMKVTAMKARLEALKRAREGKRATKIQGKMQPT